MSDEKKEAPKAVPAPAPAPAPAPVSKPHYLVIVGEASPPEIIRCEDRAAFASAVQKRVLGSPEQVYAFGFIGDRIDIAAPTPSCSIKIGNDIMRLGEDSPQFDESGKIVPLVRGDA